MPLGSIDVYPYIISEELVKDRYSLYRILDTENYDYLFDKFEEAVYIFSINILNVYPNMKYFNAYESKTLYHINMLINSLIKERYDIAIKHFSLMLEERKNKKHIYEYQSISKLIDETIKVYVEYYADYDNALRRKLFEYKIMQV